MGEVGSDGGGVLRFKACCTTSGGGRALGDMIMPGACEGSWGRRDHIAHTPAFRGDGDALRDAGGEIDSDVDIVPICE